MATITTHNFDFDKMVEKAIIFLVQNFISSGRNPKPVILHSIRTGLYLYKENYSQDVVVAAILHDVLEDTDVILNDIEKEFGIEIGKLVSANTFNILITNKYDRDIDMLDRCKDAGKWALLIKAADILDNGNYLKLVKDEEQLHRILRRTRLFLELSENELSNEPIYSILKQHFEEFVKSSDVTP